MCMRACVCEVASVVSLSDPVDHSLPGSSVQGILQARIWSGLPCPPQRDLPDPGSDCTSLMSPTLAGRFFTTSATWEAPECVYWQFIFIYRHHVMFMTKLGFMLLSLVLLLNISRNWVLMSVYYFITWRYCILTFLLWFEIYVLFIFPVRWLWYLFSADIFIYKFLHVFQWFC